MRTQWNKYNKLLEKIEMKFLFCMHARRSLYGLDSTIVQLFLEIFDHNMGWKLSRFSGRCAYLGSDLPFHGSTDE